MELVPTADFQPAWQGPQAGDQQSALLGVKTTLELAALRRQM